MKHAVIISEEDRNKHEKLLEVQQNDGKVIYLAESEYLPEELEEFNGEKDKWIVCCKGSHNFLADSDSGEDATGYYCSYFDLTAERAVFDQGKLVGFYICTDGFSYSGRGRYNFEINDFGYPGADPFISIPLGAGTHVFLFAEKETHRWKDWSLLERDPKAEYKSYLKF